MSALRIVADWLEHEEYGVNALLATLPRDGTELPAASVKIVNELDHGWVARLHIPGDVPKGGPYLAVTLAAEGNDFDPMPQPVRDDEWVLEGRVAVMLLYVTRDSKSERGTRHAHEVFRAARASLTILFGRLTPDAARKRDECWLVTCAGFRLLPLREERGDALITGGLVASYATREAVPIRTPDPVPPPET